MKRSLFGTVAIAAVALSVVLIGTASAAKPPADTNSNCPTSGTKNLLASLNVTASYSAGTYSVQRFGPAAPTSLVKYCVYANQTPTALDATAVGADGSDWTQSKLAKTFSFSRAGGEKSNLALTGSKQDVGTANFGTQPTTNDIVLHISDGGQCFNIYGVVTPTCFVLPGTPTTPCTFGDKSAGYNALPTGVEHCSPPSLGFEATGTTEFGDLVTLSTTGTVNSMIVDFQSYGCSDSGNWNKGATFPCQSTDGETFTVPGGITASIYNPAGPGGLVTPIATSTINPNIPFRPDADPINCPGAGGNGPDDIGSRWFDPVSGACNNSLSVPLTFPFANQSLPSTVVWTVQFDTSHSGYQKIGDLNPCNATEQGCGYDSLNVGAKSYLNAPYAGTDPSEDTAYRSLYAPNYQLPITPLGAESGWTDFRPLGQIILN